MKTTVKRFDMTLKGGGAFGLDSDLVLDVPAFITLTNVDNLIGANGTIGRAETLINQSKGRVEGLILNGTGTIMSTTPARSRLTRLPIRRESRLVPAALRSRVADSHAGRAKPELPMTQGFHRDVRFLRNTGRDAFSSDVQSPRRCAA